jgi:hypothetical protein
MRALTRLTKLHGDFLSLVFADFLRSDTLSTLTFINLRIIHIIIRLGLSTPRNTHSQIFSNVGFFADSRIRGSQDIQE